MATVNLYLHGKDRLGQVYVFIVVQSYGKKVKLPTGVKINPDYWDSNNQKVKKSYRGFVELNSSISRKRDEVYAWVLEAEREGVSSVLDFVRRKEKGLKSRSARRSLFEDLQEFIRINKLQKSEGTIKGYNTLLRDLTDFQKTTDYRVDFDTIDHEFEVRYRSYLIEKGNIDNTLGKKIQILKSYLGDATKRRVNNYQDFRSFKATRVQPHKIALDFEELKTLLNLDLSTNKRLSDVRDVFCFACFTGLRFSDIEQLRPAHISKREDKHFIEISTIKTGARVTITLPHYAVKILEKHQGKEGELLPVISNQKTNEYLKELCKLAGFDSKVITVKNSGASRIEKELFRYELISFHTARNVLAP